MTARSVSISTILLAVLFVLPIFAHAQAGTNADLSAQIRAALASDPRTSSMNPAQIDAMVQALTQKAAQSGLTAQDIAWRPVTDQPAGAAALSECAGAPSFLCNLSEAWGFTGPDAIIAVWLGISALLLIFLLGAFLEYRHFRHLHPKNQP